MINKKYLYVLCITVTLIIGVTLGIWQTKPPQVNQTSPMYPDYESMMTSLQKMTVEPHPSNSSEIDVVRKQILDEIEDMGLTPIIQNTVYTVDEIIKNFLALQGITALDDKWWRINEKAIAQYYGIHDFDEFMDVFFNQKVGDDGTLPLTNILVKLDAPDTNIGVLFVAHYDSTDKGPGAADNMLSVVSLMEALRSQSQNNALKNDLYFLFTDGEEHGALGAFRFAEAYPELKDKIDLVINSEARGNRGGLMLFETSPNAYHLIETIKKSGIWLYGYSIGAKIYSLMPNYTDLTVFLNEGYNGLNFASIEGVEVYHTMEDSYENLNHETAWNYLQAILSLTDYSANNSLEDLQKTSREAIFFPFLPCGIVLMTDSVSHILCMIACIFALLACMQSFRKKQLKFTNSTIFMGLLILLSIACEIFFVVGSYLFYISLLLMAITSSMEKWPMVHIASKMVSGVIVLMLWVPIIIVTWWTLLVPMLL